MKQSGHVNKHRVQLAAIGTSGARAAGTALALRMCSTLAQPLQGVSLISITQQLVCGFIVPLATLYDVGLLC